MGWREIFVLISVTSTPILSESRDSKDINLLDATETPTLSYGGTIEGVSVQLINRLHLRFLRVTYLISLSSSSTIQILINTLN